MNYVKLLGREYKREKGIRSMTDSKKIRRYKRKRDSRKIH